MTDFVKEITILIKGTRKYTVGKMKTIVSLTGALVLSPRTDQSRTTSCYYFVLFGLSSCFSRPSVSVE